MAISTPPDAAKSFTCAHCPSPKPAAWCRDCPRERGTHFVDARLNKPADILILSETPVIPRISDVRRIHSPFSDDGGKLLNDAVNYIKSKNPANADLQVAKTYAVLCTGLDPNKATIDRCKNFLTSSLACVSGGSRTPIILAMGMGPLKALGVKAQSLKEVQGRIIPGQVIGDKTYTVVATMSQKMLISMSGMYTTFLNDLSRCFQIITDGDIKPITIEELTKPYVFPKTVAEVKDICEYIINYTEGNTAPENWMIAADTETNTKFPHRANLKLLCVSFAWATGKSTAIPLWHPETPYDPQLVVPYVRAVFESQKPKVFHNAKFDLKVIWRQGWNVNRFKWDSMLGEHALEEDKKGQYGLKELTRVNFPEYAAYADVLHEMLEKIEGDSQLENIRKAQKDAANDDAAALSTEQKKKPKTPKKKRKGQIDGGFEKIPLATLLPYAGVDPDITRRITLGQLTRISTEETRIQQVKQLSERDRQRTYPVPRLCTVPQPTKNIVTNHAVPLTGTLARMELRGVHVDRVYLEKLQNDLETVIVGAEADLYRMTEKTPETLKLNHAASIAKILFSEGFIHPETKKRTYYPPVTMTAKGQWQTTEKVLKFLVAKEKCPFSAKKLIYSKAYKAKNTFCKNVWDLSELDGYLHTNYNIHGTGTGRLSSNDENMQNIPKKLSGFSIKKVFITSDPISQAFVNLDAKNAEVRIFAAYSHDAALIKSLADGLDSHCFFADAIIKSVRASGPGADEQLRAMGLDPAKPLTYDDFKNREKIKLTDPKYAEQMDVFRTNIKRVVFGILYGAGPKKIAETAGMTLTQAQAIRDLLFELFPSIPAYVEATKWELRNFGFVETYFGRRRRFNVRGATGYLRGRAERQAVNFKIQSTSSDIVLTCLSAIEQPLERDLGGRLLLTVHDSIGLEMPKKYLSQLPDFVEQYLVKDVAKMCPWLPVAFKWDYEVGDSYGELKPLEKYIEGIPQEERLTDAQQAYDEEEVRTTLADIDAA